MLQTGQKIYGRQAGRCVTSELAFYRELSALDVQETCTGRRIPNVFFRKKPVGVRPGYLKVPVVGSGLYPGVTGGLGDDATLSLRVHRSEGRVDPDVG